MQFLSASTAALGWLCILIFAAANGGLRETVLIPNLGALVGTALSGVLLTAAVVIVTTLLLRWRAPRSLRHAAWLGVSWLVATLAFEFAFGLLVQGKAVQELLTAYTFQGGNLWPVVLLAVLVAPYAVAALMQHKQTAVRDDA